MPALLTPGNAEPQLGKGRGGEGIADEEPPAKLGLGVPGNLIRSLTPRFAARQ
jgi:hypothetical protein